jgi:SAM-dependent methyltransferase
MVRYLMVAAALKLLSTCPQTRRAYRWLGDQWWAKRRIRLGLPKSYVDRATQIHGLFEKHNFIEKGDQLLEIGTGWLHWESVVIRSFYNVKITLFDVRDCRQLQVLKRYSAEFAGLVCEEMDTTPMQCEHVRNMLGVISSASSFDDLYHLLGFHYVIQPSGTLDCFQDESFAAIFSYSVLEHVKKDILSEYIQDFGRLLKPGGYSIHTIDMGDHLSYYDRSVSVKNYLRFSDAAWKRWFENEVQYFNRVQRSEWLRLFNRAGLELVEEESLYSDIGTISIGQNLDRRDLECKVLQVVHRKPE